MAKAKSTSKFKGKGDGLQKAFYTIQLFDGQGNQYEDLDQNGPQGICLNHFTIDFAQFCHQPLSHLLLDAVVSTAKIPEFLFIRIPHKIHDKLKELKDQPPEELIPGLPSGHHQYIRFRTEQYYPGTGNKVWGTIEKLEDGPICALYKNERDSVRAGARVTQNGLLPFSEQLEMYIKVPICAEKVLKWNGNYHLSDNNCIHYALECWERLGGRATWNEVVDGHDSYLPGDYDAGGRDCNLM